MFCLPREAGDLRRIGLGLAAETADRETGGLEFSLFSLTIARPQSRVVVGQDSPQLCGCQVSGAAIVQMRLVELAAQVGRPPRIPVRCHGRAYR